MYALFFIKFSYCKNVVILIYITLEEDMKRINIFKILVVIMLSLVLFPVSALADGESDVISPSAELSLGADARLQMFAYSTIIEGYLEGSFFIDEYQSLGFGISFGAESGGFLEFGANDYYDFVFGANMHYLFDAPLVDNKWYMPAGVRVGLLAPGFDFVYPYIELTVGIKYYFSDGFALRFMMIAGFPTLFGLQAGIVFSF